MGQETLIIFSILLIVLVLIGISKTMWEFNVMEQEPEQYSPTKDQEDIEVKE
jgi:hypothetical protein